MSSQRSSPAWVGKSACSDIWVNFLQTRLGGLGVDISRVARLTGCPTGLGVALIERDDRAILTYAGTIDAVQPDDLTDNLLATIHKLQVRERMQSYASLGRSSLRLKHLLARSIFPLIIISAFRRRFTMLTLIVH